MSANDPDIAAELDELIDSNLDRDGCLEVVLMNDLAIVDRCRRAAAEIRRLRSLSGPDPVPAPLGWYRGRDGSVVPATRDHAADVFRREGYATQDGGRTWTRTDHPK